MSTEENYLDSLLKSMTEPQEAESTDENAADKEMGLDSLEVEDVEPEIELSDTELSDIEMHEVDAPAVEVSETVPDRGNGFADGHLNQDEILNLISQVLEENDSGEDGHGENNSEAGSAPEDAGYNTEDAGKISEINIDGLDEVIQSATETELAGELNIDDLGIDKLDLGTSDSAPNTVLSDAEEELNIEDVFDEADVDESPAAILEYGSDDELSLNDIIESSADEDKPAETEKVSLADAGAESEANDDDDADNFSVDMPDVETLDMPDVSLAGAADVAIDENEMPAVDKEDADDGLDNLLSLLDEEADSDVAEINNMLKKNDNNELIQDDMMDLLHQMADNEAEFVNSGELDTDDSDEGIPPVPNLDVVKRVENKKAEALETEKEKSKKKKAAKKKKKGRAESEDGEPEVVEKKTEKKPGAMGRFLNMLTEDLVPEPTEEELAAEKAAKEAKKQENLTKKEEEKAAKDEAKKAKAEEKAAEKKAKAAEAEQKKKEKKAAKAAKLEAKRAKEASKPPVKRIPPKKLMIGAVFGATVFGAVMVVTNILSEQGYLQKAKKAYYSGDYMTAYRAVYGMELSPSDDIIKGSSETILRMERKYDSYKNNVKMGRELEALDALISSFETYDYINTDAEQYGVLAEVDAIMDDISNILLSDYGIDEAAARELLKIEDPLSYSMALNDIINKK